MGFGCHEEIFDSDVQNIIWSLFAYRFMSSKAVKKQLNSLLAPTQETLDNATKTKSLAAKKSLKKQKKKQQKAQDLKNESNPLAARSKALRFLKRTTAPSDESLQLMQRVASLHKKK